MLGVIGWADAVLGVGAGVAAAGLALNLYVHVRDCDGYVNWNNNRHAVLLIALTMGAFVLSEYAVAKLLSIELLMRIIPAHVVLGVAAVASYSLGEIVKFVRGRWPEEGLSSGDDY